MFLWDDESGGQIEILDDVSTLEERDEGVFCRTCGACIAHWRDRVEKDGKHSHTVFNPAGIVYRIRCFTKAPGCFCPDDIFSSEFTWFAEYLWTVALCARCSTHMGWQFVGQEHSFFGLIDTNIWVG